MKKLLIMKSARDEVVEGLADYLREHEKGAGIIWILQGNFREKALRLTPGAKVYHWNGDCFSVKGLLADEELYSHLRSEKPDEIYIPSSSGGKHGKGLEEVKNVYFVALRLSPKKIFLYNRAGRLIRVTAAHWLQVTVGSFLRYKIGGPVMRLFMDLACRIEHILHFHLCVGLGQNQISEESRRRKDHGESDL